MIWCVSRREAGVDAPTVWGFNWSCYWASQDLIDEAQATDQCERLPSSRSK